MDSMASIETMLFGLKEATKDSDALHVKNEIDRRLSDLDTFGEKIDLQENKNFIIETVSAVSSSLELRQKQVLTDSQIVQKINIKIDSFRTEHKLKMDGLIYALMQDIDDAIHNYEQELTRHLNPFTIKERFKKKEDFELYLNTLNNAYKENMEKAVDRKTQNTIRNYLHDVEDVFEAAASYLSERQSFIPVEDMFYGSLAQSKNMIMREVRHNINELSMYNKSLYDASVELFNSIWQARKEYDQKRFATTAAITGGVATVAVLGASYAMGAAAATGIGAQIMTGALLLGKAAISVKALPIIAVAIVGGIVIAKTASKLSAAMYSSRLEQDVKAAVNEFKSEIYNSKIAMQRQITERIKEIFENELKSLDRTFLDFRKVTYIDENKIPKISEIVNELEKVVVSV